MYMKTILITHEILLFLIVIEASQKNIYIVGLDAIMKLAVEGFEKKEDLSVPDSWYLTHAVEI